MTKKMSSVFMVSLGCPKNLVDTEVMAGNLVLGGRAIAMDEEMADIYLINTCAFLPAARQEAYDVISEAVEWKALRKGRKIVVAGCINEKLSAEQLKADFPEVDVWLRVDAMPELSRILDGGDVPECGSEPCYLADHNAPRLLLTMPHVAYLKISDGCNNRCSYCSIPGIRGSLRSRSIASVAAEAENLLAGGVKELVVIAQDITAFGADRPDDGEDIAKLIRALNDLDGKFKIRLLYTHPAHYSDEFIQAMAECDKVIPYLDIPLQHVNDRILQAMGRHTTKAAIEDLLKRMREAIPNLVMRTTFITGFPGESEAEFEELKEFMLRWKFERCGVFAFSPEPDTEASDMPDQIPLEVAEKRAEELMALQENIMLARHEEFIGKVDSVLIDDVSGSKAVGRGLLDAPDIDNHVHISDAKGLKIGEYCDIVITGAEPYRLLGKPAHKMTAKKESKKKR